MSDPRDEKRARKAAFDCGSAFLTHGLPGRAGPEEGEVKCYEIILRALESVRREDQEEIEQEVRRLIVIERAETAEHEDL